MHKNMSSGKGQNAQNGLHLYNLVHFALSVFLFIVFWSLFLRGNNIAVAPKYSWFVTGGFAVVLLFFIRTYNGYLTGFSSSGNLIYSQCIATVFSTGIIYVIVSIIWQSLYNPLFFILLIAAGAAWNSIWSITANALYYAMNKPLNTIILYRNKKDVARLADIERFPKIFQVSQKIRVDEDVHLDPVLNQIKNVGAVFAVGIPATQRNSVAKYCVEHGIKGYFSPHIGDVIMSGADQLQSFSVPIYNVNRASITIEYAFIKRAFDIFFSLVLIVLSSPIMLGTAIAIKCFDKGPVFYKQVRLTKDGKLFKIIKFRSMRVNAEADGVARLSSQGDSRITPIGKIIRACRIDELPQLFNILAGDMTVVGPRPERPELADEYEKTIPAFKLRLQVKAGLTGYAQVVGRYNTDPYDKLEMDLQYINKMSVLLDFQLIFATFKILFLKDSTSGIQAGKTSALLTDDDDDDDKPVDNQ